MPFEIIRADIAGLAVDAIVNSANPLPCVGAGVDSRIHRKAGRALLEARESAGILSPGQAVITPGFGLPAKFVIHTVAPAWNGGSQGETAVLEMCYHRSLDLALRSGCRSVAFPLLAAGNLQFPKDLALETALRSIRSFLRNRDMDVTLVVFDRDVFQLSGSLHHRVKSFIDEKYVQQVHLREYGISASSWDESAAREFSKKQQERRNAEKASCSKMAAPSPVPRPMENPAPKKSRLFPALTRPSLADRIKHLDAGFSETLLKLIDSTGRKDSDIYNKANVSRQHFSKIRNDPDYKPTKATAVAFAMALELDLAQTRDLIGRAGYALTESSKFDVIIMFFIQERIYDLYEINATLFDFDQPLLGTKNVT